MYHETHHIARIPNCDDRSKHYTHDNKRYGMPRTGAHKRGVILREARLAGGSIQALPFSISFAKHLPPILLYALERPPLAVLPSTLPWAYESQY